ncbi:MAG: rhodanese-like domain-containing protein [Halioglobus sp.]
MNSYFTKLTVGLAAIFFSFTLSAEIPVNAVWIDVRTPAEYDRGHLSDATLIPYDSIEKGIAALNLPKDTPIYLYCAVGGRAEKAKQSLEAINYTQVTNVGGLDDARKLVPVSVPVPVPAPTKP